MQPVMKIGLWAGGGVIFSTLLFGTLTLAVAAFEARTEASLAINQTKKIEDLPRYKAAVEYCADHSIEFTQMLDRIIAIQQKYPDHWATQAQGYGSCMQYLGWPELPTK